MILTDQEFISAKHLPFEMKQVEKYSRGNPNPELIEMADDMSLDQMEKVHLSRVLRRLEWNKSKVAKTLGISRATLRAKIRKYSIANN
jgi:transcriptional regulator with PAS, ATPase and Fis domain